MIIPSKHSGYRAGIRLYPGGGDSGGPSSQTVTQTNVPDYARPYVEDVLGRSQALSTQNVYQPYGGQRVAGATGLQNQAAATAAGMQPSGELGQASNMANNAGNRAAGLGVYTAGTFNAGNAPTDVGTNWGYSPVGSQMWNGNVAQQYMNPYMQAVVDVQKREATRQSDIMGQQQNAQAVGAGAFGGSRNAIVEAERQRNLGQQLNDIQATGSNAAYNNAQQMFTSDQGRNLQGQMANQQAGLTTNTQNLQGQQANQQAGLSFNSQRLQAQQLGEQSRQYASQAGLAGLQAQLSAAGLLQGIGQDRYGQQMGITQLQNQIGSQQQTTNQSQLDANYQDWVNQQMFPYRQLEFQNNILRGNYSPNTTTSVYGGYGSPASQMAGLGTAAYGMSKMMAKGGKVEDVAYRDIKPRKQKYAGGGLVDAIIASIK